MDIQTVAENLRNTIAGKEMLLAEYTDMRDSLSKETDLYQALYAHWHTSVEMLQINIDELKRILQDVEKCMEWDQHALSTFEKLEEFRKKRNYPIPPEA